MRYLKISRPRFWIYELGPYLVGVAAASQGELAVWLTLPVVIFFIFFTYPANVYIYGINDIYDYETDRHNPKKVQYEALVMPHEARPLLVHIGIVNVPFLAYAWFAVPPLALVALAVFFICAGYYSAPPIRAKAKPLLDSIFSAGHYVATGAFAYLLIDGGGHEISTLVLCLAAGMCWAAAMHAFSAVPDIRADREANLETVATKLGKTWTILLCALLYAAAGVIALPYLGIIGIALTSAYVLIMLFALRAPEARLFRIYTYFPTVNTIAGMAVFFIALLS